MTYTITYGNNQLEPVDLIVKEDYDPQTVFHRILSIARPRHHQHLDLSQSSAGRARPDSDQDEDT